jgi:hypothetical protein
MIDRIGGGSPIAPASPQSTPGESFSKVLKGPGGQAGVGNPAGNSPVAPAAKPIQAPKPAAPPPVLKPKAAAVSPAGRSPSAQMVGQLAESQRKLDRILKMAESGRTFSPAELLAFQAHAYRASQEIDMASKVVDKATGAIKQTLQTQV